MTTTARSRGTDDPDADLRHRLALVFVVAIPFFVAFWVGVVALAVSFTGTAYGPVLAMAAAVGVLAGLFWGAWYAFLAYSRQEDAERKAAIVAGRQPAVEQPRPTEDQRPDVKAS